MTEPGPDGRGADDPALDEPPAADPVEDDALAEVKEAAGAVLVSLRWLLDAAERALADDEAVDAVVDAGRGIARAFTEGFASDPGDIGDDR
mgnify:FL=1